MPPRSNAPAKRRKQAAKPKRPSLGFRILTGIIGVVICPVVFLVSLFRPTMKVGKQWIISITVLMIICAGFAWTSASMFDKWSADALRVLGEYDIARINVKDVPFAQTINLEALRNGLDPSLVAAIISQESGFQPDAVSWSGARGLMQISQETWKEFMPEAQCKGDHAPPACSITCIYNVDSNVHVGTAYLRYLIDQNQGDIISALSSYNAKMPAEAANSEKQPGSTVSDGTEPSPAKAAASTKMRADTRNVIQSWVDMRSDFGAARVDLVEKAYRTRTIASWAVIALLLLLLVWAAVRYPGQS